MADPLGRAAKTSTRLSVSSTPSKKLKNEQAEPLQSGAREHAECVSPTQAAVSRNVPMHAALAHEQVSREFTTQVPP